MKPVLGADVGVAEGMGVAGGVSVADRSEAMNPV